jgi:hypothetical protein
VAAATADGCPPATPPDTTPPDTTPPVLSLGGKKKQTEDGTIEIHATCDTDCSAAASGAVTVKSHSGHKRAATKAAKQFQLPAAAAQLAAGQTTTLKLKLPKKANRAALRALKHRGHVSASIAVTAADANANASTTSEILKLARPHRGPHH